MTDEEFDKLWSRLVGSVQRNIHDLEREELLFYSVNILRGAIPRSGFIGYFENNSGPVISAAHDGLAEMNLSRSAEILREAQKIALGGITLPRDETPLSLISSATEELYEQESERLEHALADAEDRMLEQEENIWNALIQYAQDMNLN